jgi:hypothetical protein
MKLKLIIFPLCMIAMHAFGFEGSIKQVVKNYNGTGTTLTMTWYLSAHNYRVDMAASGKGINSNSVFIMDAASQTLKTYEASGGAGKKLYFQVDAGSIAGDLSIISVNITQEVRQINGYKCEKWIVVTSSGTYNVWITRTIDADWSSYKSFFKTSVEIQALASQGVRGFAMLTESNNGNNTMGVETVSIQAVPAITFAIPSEYTLFVPQTQSATQSKTK